MIDVYVYPKLRPLGYQTTVLFQDSVFPQMFRYRIRQSL
jgi:hypothetical protein